jgi:ABC-2 type transport system ATP-binding protein
MSTVLEFSHLSRSYKRGVPVLKDVSFSIGEGEVLGLLGRNGAGKTTLIHIALGLLYPQGGEVRVFGKSPRMEGSAVRESIGYVAEDAVLRGGATIGELLSFHRSFFPRWNDALEADLLGRFGLSRRDRIQQLSNGQRRQVALLTAVSHYPKLLLLDEPAAGLDPAARREFLETSIQLLNSEGTTILVSSHHMTDVERLGGRVVLLDQGVVKLDRGLDQVREEICIAIVPQVDAPDGAVFEQAAGCLRVRAARENWHIVIEGTPDDVHTRLSDLIGNDRFRCASVPLEELFVELVGNER